MKKQTEIGTEIKISANAKYYGQDMRWTEQKSWEGWTDEKMCLFHFSDDFIESFCPKQTCFFTDANAHGHCYLFIFPKGVEAAFYPTNEYRMDLRWANPKIYYLGERRYDNHAEFAKKANEFYFQLTNK